MDIVLAKKQMMKKIEKKDDRGYFPDGPVVKTLHFQTNKKIMNGSPWTKTHLWTSRKRLGHRGVPFSASFILFHSKG